MIHIPKDLEWLAKNVRKWPSSKPTVIGLDLDGEVRFDGHDSVSDDYYPEPRIPFEFRPTSFLGPRYAKSEWQAARRELGLDESLDTANPAESDAASRAVGWGQPTEEEEEAFNEMERKQIGQPPSKYHVCIKGVWLDVYDILHAYQRNNPADQHAIKKMLMPGQRGVKDAIQDRREAIQSLERAIELEAEK